MKAVLTAGGGFATTVATILGVAGQYQLSEPVVLCALGAICAIAVATLIAAAAVTRRPPAVRRRRRATGWGSWRTTPARPQSGPPPASRPDAGGRPHSKGICSGKVNMSATQAYSLGWLQFASWGQRVRPWCNRRPSTSPRLEAALATSVVSGVFTMLR
jgi:hypothetical protein